MTAVLACLEVLLCKLEISEAPGVQEVQGYVPTSRLRKQPAHHCATRWQTVENESNLLSRH